MRVELVAHSGSDLLVVDAARASFGKVSDWERKTFDTLEEAEEYAATSRAYVEYDHIYSDRWFGGYPTTGLSEKDAKLIHYLAREGHVLPFRHPQITLRIKAPIFVARQLGKTQVGFSWSEESRRYIDSEPEFYFPDKWRKRADNVKQGSSDEEVEKIVYTQPESGHVIEYSTQEFFEDSATVAVETYNKALASGVAPELARIILPQNMYTTFVWTGSLLGYCQMLKLRQEAHAQKEIRDLANMIADVIRPLYPVSYSALMGVGNT